MHVQSAGSDGDGQVSLGGGFDVMADKAARCEPVSSPSLVRYLPIAPVMSGQGKDEAVETDHREIAKAVSDSVEHIRRQYRWYFYRMLLLDKGGNRVTSTDLPPRPPGTNRKDSL